MKALDLFTTLPTMHGYWHAVMDSFVAELAGSRGFSLIPREGLSMVASVNPRLLLPSRSVLVLACDYPAGWEKKVKVINLPVPSKKALAKPKSAGKTKSATPLPLAGASPASRTRGSKRKTTPHPVSTTERRVSYSSFFLFFFFLLIKFLNCLAANSPISSISFLLVQA